MATPPPPYQFSENNTNEKKSTDTDASKQGSQSADNHTATSAATAAHGTTSSPGTGMGVLPPNGQAAYAYPYATAAAAPYMTQQQQQIAGASNISPPSQQQQAAGAALPGSTTGGMAGGAIPQCFTSPQVMPAMAYPGAGAAPAGIPMYPPAAIPMQPMFGQPAAQNGGINLVVNTNANSNSNSGSSADTRNGAGGANATPALRPCPKCRMGYITRGQARFRETCIKMLAYGTICCTCLLPLRLLKTNYVDKCSYCGEEYGFRGELFEKPKPPKK